MKSPTEVIQSKLFTKMDPQNLTDNDKLEETVHQRRDQSKSWKETGRKSGWHKTIETESVELTWAAFQQESGEWDKEGSEDQAAITFIATGNSN